MSRKNRIITYFLASLLFFPGVSGAGETAESAFSKEWTLPAAITHARDNAPTARIAEARVTQAAAVLQQARSAFLPRVDLKADYTVTTAPNMAFGMILNQEEFDNSIDFNNPGQIDNLSLGAVATYRLYAGGSRTARLQAARAGTAAAEFAEESALTQLEYTVTAAWYVIRQAQALGQARQANVEALAASLEVARAEFDAGAMLKTEVLNLEVQLSQAREELVNARAALDLGKAALVRVLGLETEKISLADCDNQRPQLPAERSYTNRPDLLAAKAEVLAAEKSVRAAAGERLPKVDAFAGAQQDTGYDTGGTGESWMAGVKLSLNIFSGGEVTGKIAEAKAKLAQAVENYRQAELGARFEVRSAELAYQEARERLEVTGQAVDQARESADLSRARFEEGALLASDLIDVENRLTTARVNRAVAESRLNIALADLRRALGLSQLQESAK